MRSRQRLLQALVGGLLGLACWDGLCPLRGQVTGGMLSPDIDPPGEPFSYFWHPTDVIGALYDPVASEVTPEGYVYTGFGELMFFVGNPPEPVNQRIKTLYHGYLPMVQYHLRRDGVRYSFTMFAADLGKALQGLPVSFVEVRLRNEAKQERTAFLGSAYRFTAPINRLGGLADYHFTQRFDLIPKRYTEGQTAFNPNWKYSFGTHALVRDGHLLYVYPTRPEPWQESLSLGDNGLRMYRFFTGEVEGTRDPQYVLDPHTPMGVVTYRVSLKPGESQSLIFKMPLVPIAEDSEEARQVDGAEYPQNFDRTVSLWEGLVGKSPPLRFPEAKVQQALLANTVFDLLAIDKVGDDYIPNVNKFQYHYFYGGSDTSHMLVALDYLGLTEPATKGARYSLKSQSPEGAYLSHDDTDVVHYWEMFGNTLWTWGRHYLLTRDDSFLHQVYPSVVRAMEWEMRVTHQDPLGLIPPFGVPDDAWLKNAHQTGQDLWTLAGIRNAIVMAKAMGGDQDPERFRAEYQRFWQAFEKQLAIQTSQTGGYIPPGLDRTLRGDNWDNLLTLYPEPLFEPFDPRVTATIRESRTTYEEGILGYVLPRALAKKGNDYIFDSTRLLHYWHSLDNAENGLIRGDPEDQELAVKDLYAMLLHTTSTHAPQEFGTEPWSTRDLVDEDILPDGATSGTLIELMRNMLVRENRNDLFLFSAVSPAWLKQGSRIEVLNEPTVFGPVSARFEATNDGWEVRLSNRFREPPQHVFIGIPWFFEVQKAEADGHPAEVTEGRLMVSASTREVKVTGRIKPSAPEMSFELGVEDYKREYKRRYQEFLRTGTSHP